MNPKFDYDKLTFRDGKVVSILMTMGKESFDGVEADMTAKLGRKPDNTDPSTFQNAYGAKWSFNKAIWLGMPGVIVEDNVLPSAPLPPLFAPPAVGREGPLHFAACQHDRIRVTRANLINIPKMDGILDYTQFDHGPYCGERGDRRVLIEHSGG